MKFRTVNQRNAAFTSVEFFIVLVSAFVLFFLVTSGLPRRGCGAKGTRVKCTGNLKQLALAFNLWAQDYETGLPMEVFESKGGTKEAARGGQLLPNLLIMSNQLGTPSILICPEDKKRKPVTTFSNLTAVNVSYFLNVDAALTNQNHVIAGDRNLAMAGLQVRSGLLQITNVGKLQWANYNGQIGYTVAAATWPSSTAAPTKSPPKASATSSPSADPPTASSSRDRFIVSFPALRLLAFAFQ